MDTIVTCRCCNAVLVEATPYDVTRHPCPECGSTCRIIPLDIVQSLKLYERFRIRQTAKGVKKPVHDQLFGDDYTHATGRFNKKVRIIDRTRDRYYECITDPDSGKVLYERKEPLSHHYGRGSAKFQEHGIPQEEIAMAAYYVWQRAGEPHGWDQNHWYMAIEDLKRARAGVPTIYS